MSIGPVEFLTIAFPGNRFDGSIVPELERLVSSGTVRIIDLVFVSKDAEGNITTYEYEDLEGDAAAFGHLDGEAGDLISDEDIELAAADLDLESSAVFLLWEDLWAAPFAEAVRAADGVIVAGGRIPHEAVQAALEAAAG
ncbi:MAG: hypothetical protein KDB04_07960 [Acidimicrobiales bacterium]|nr:hypothetical protein [Acidimicrobiales bacterium]HRW37487.1 DUF6325 family protein [Aquihabitans sp.]